MNIKDQTKDQIKEDNKVNRDSVVKSDSSTVVGSKEVKEVNEKKEKKLPPKETWASRMERMKPSKPQRNAEGALINEFGVIEKYRWEIWLESKGVPLGWWKGTWLEPFVVIRKILRMMTLVLGIPYSFFKGIDWYYGDPSSVYRDAKKGSGG